MYLIALRITLGIAISIGAGVAVHDAAFAQENRGTLQQQLACTPDVFRLCSEAMPDVNRIVACLRQNTDQLSDPCRAVFDSNASAPQPTPQQTVPARRPRYYTDQ
jgi:hypothetical protein